MAKKQEPKQRRSLNTRLEDAIASADDIIVAGMNPDPSRVGESAPAAGSALVGSPDEKPQPTPSQPEPQPTSPIYPDCVSRALAEKPKTLIAFTPTAIDIKLATLSSQERISKKRIVLEALLDYLHKRDLLTDEERDQWLQLPKEFGTPAK